MAQMTFRASADIADASEGWTPQTSILLPLGPVTRAGANRRIKKRGRPVPSDLLQHLPGEVELLLFVEESQNEMQGLAARLNAVLSEEYGRYEAIATATRARLKDVWGAHGDSIE